MTLVLKPSARNMVVCEDVATDDRWPGKAILVGPVSWIRWPEEETEQVTLPTLCVYLVLSGGRGTGRVRISCINEETEAELFPLQEMTLSFEGRDPSRPYTGVVRLNDCEFPKPGIYVVRFLFENEEVEHRILSVR